MLTFPWILDGIAKWEGLAIQNLSYISAIDAESATLMLSFPWISDGISPGESSAVSSAFSLMDEYPSFAKQVLDLWWVPDDMPKVEQHAFSNLLDLARSNLEMAWRVIEEPFMAPPFRRRDEYALNSLSRLSPNPKSSCVSLDLESGRTTDDGPCEDLPRWIARAALLADLNAQSLFNDGLDDLEAALLYAIVTSAKDFQRALIDNHHVESVPVNLALTGDVELIVVRHTPFPSDDHTFATLEKGLRTIEGFMGTPFPVDDVILILVEPDIWDVGAGKFVASVSGGAEPAYTSAYMLANNSESGPAKASLYHEIAHHYRLYGPSWLIEGAAQFLEAYVLAQYGGEDLETRLTRLDSSKACGRENIQQHIDDYGGERCDYNLGEKILLALYAALGGEAVSAALRDLYTQSQFFVYLNEAIIYTAFFSNTPPGSEEAFKTIYRQYHGGPIVDAVLADAPDLPALTALYDATLGEGWVNNGNWVGDAPLGSWHGVATDPEGRVRILNLEDNGLVGAIPPELGRLSELRSLYLSVNSLVGQIPPELGSLSELTTLRLGRNQLSGDIPSELGNLSNLQTLGLWENQLVGRIPPDLAGMRSLRSLDLQVNRLNGEIPPELASLRNLSSLSLSRNLLSGEIPRELGALVELTWLDIGKNQLSGEIPAELGNLSNLRTLRLWNNRLVGRIPPELANLTNLGSLELNNNHLDGEIPPQLANLTKLRDLNLEGNQLSGVIPPELAKLPNLYALKLNRNNLSGKIPREFGNLGDIEILDLRANQLTGEIPSELGRLTSLETLYLGGNQFSGCIPDALRDISENDLDELGLPFCSAP